MIRHLTRQALETTAASIFTMRNPEELLQTLYKTLYLECLLLMSLALGQIQDSAQILTFQDSTQIHMFQGSILTLISLALAQVPMFLVSTLAQVPTSLVLILVMVAEVHHPLLKAYQLV